MNKFIETLRNIWSIKELRDKILFTLMILAVYRLGTYIVLPGVNPAVLAAGETGRKANDLLQLINTFTGGAFNQGSIFALGIMPYITASIIVQLLGFAVPYFQRLQQKEGESGRKKLNQITRFLTLLVTLVQGSTFLIYLKSQNAVDLSINQGVWWFSNMIILAAGTIFAMWLGEKITDRGIGNGISLLIMVGIIAKLPISFISEIQSQIGGNRWIPLILELVVFLFVIIATILIVQGVRKIPIQAAKRMIGRTADSAATAGGANDFINLKLSAAGVMPIIFAQAIMFLPLSALQYANGTGAQSDTLMQFSDWKSFPYNLLFFILIVVFTYVYTALIVNPQSYAEFLKRNNSFIPGVKPGEDTQSYIDTLTTRITLPGAIFIGLIAILPAIASFMGVNDAFALFFGGTSLLILVGVVLDTLQQVESYLLMRKYDGLVKSGRVQGRNSQGINIGSGI
jgi:preprotein translocase subunit SecY